MFQRLTSLCRASCERPPFFFSFFFLFWASTWMCPRWAGISVYADCWKNKWWNGAVLKYIFSFSDFFHTSTWWQMFRSTKFICSYRLFLLATTLKCSSHTHVERCIASSKSQTPLHHSQPCVFHKTLIKCFLFYSILIIIQEYNNPLLVLNEHIYFWLHV